MKNFFKSCIVLLVMSSNMFSQNWLWVKPMNLNSPNLFGNTRLTPSGKLVNYLAESGGTHLQYVDANGNILWSQFYQNLTINDVCFDASDNIFFAGTYSATTIINGNAILSQGGLDALIGEFNSSGVLVKVKTFGTTNNEKANSIALSNNQLYVSGSFVQPLIVNSVSLTGNSSTYNTYLLKLDMNLTAQNGIETVSNDGSESVEVGVDQSGAVYLLANSQYTLSIATQSVYIADQGQVLAKFNSNLNLSWLKILNTHFMNGWYKPYMYFDNSSNLTLTLKTGGGGGADNHIRLEKYDSFGTQIWYKELMINTFDFVDQDNMDNIWAAGGYFYGAGPMNFSIVKVNATNTATVQLIWDPNIQHNVLGLAAKSNNDFYIIGNCNTGSNLNGYTCSPSNSVFMAHYGSTAAGIEKLTLNNSFSIYPNPASGTFILNATSDISDCTLCIKNTLGQTVYTTSLKDINSNFTKEIDISSQAKGIYFVELRSGDDKKVEKIVFQ